MSDPLRGHRFEVDVEGGARLIGEVYAPAGHIDADTPTVVLAHGWTLNRTLWSRVIRRLHDRLPVRIVAYDQRSHGESTRGNLAASIGQLSDDLAAVIEVVAGADRLVLCGHSMGGMTIISYAGRHTEELHDRVDGVALLGTACAEVGRPGWFGKFEAGVMHAARWGPAIPAGAFVTSRHQRFLNFGDDPDPRDVRLVRKAIASTKIRDMGSYFGALEALDERESLAALAAVPTVIMVGEKDKLTPVHYARALHEGIDGSTLLELPGKGHMLGYEATDQVVDVLAALVEGEPVPEAVNG
ncbi:alpha/beta fold hydrolase [Nostocoides australiense]|uniref:Putative lipase n=1 Tax=Nostocoides australiense Ben110 TaxID=1193182 RepID=W6K425_9MICO|nr:alpha/beta hydrolase [Tetrasphaera australiensis]CCH74274.1 putative lipase [Tetrasphaera australiensis Ben110]